MPFSVQLGLLFAVATAFTAILGFLYKHRGAIEAPDVDWRRPIHSSIVLFQSKWYTLGIVIAMGSWGFHVAALALAPISLVQSVIAGGLVLLTVTADRLFGFTVTKREWIGVALAAVGLAILAATLEGAGNEAHSEYATRTLLIWISALVALSIGVTILAQRFLGTDTTFGHHTGVMFGASAGIMWAASDTSIKALSDDTSEGVFFLLTHPLAFFILSASLVGLLISAKSLQTGKAVPVIAVTSVAANGFTIASGPIVFGEPVPDDTLGLILRILAFSLVVFAAVLTPAPIRAAERDLAPATSSG